VWLSVVAGEGIPGSWAAGLGLAVVACAAPSGRCGMAAYLPRCAGLVTSLSLAPTPDLGGGGGEAIWCSGCQENEELTGLSAPATRRKLFELARAFSEKTKMRKSKRKHLPKHQSYPSAWHWVGWWMPRAGIKTPTGFTNVRVEPSSAPSTLFCETSLPAHPL
jgi:hypothetical protein